MEFVKIFSSNFSRCPFVKILPRQNFAPYGNYVNFNIKRIGVITFYHNRASMHGNSVLIDIPRMCNRHKSCLTDYLGIDGTMDKAHRERLEEHITTPPYKIELQKPLICTDSDDDDDCTT